MTEWLGLEGTIHHCIVTLHQPALVFSKTIPYINMAHYGQVSAADIKYKLDSCKINPSLLFKQYQFK